MSADHEKGVTRRPWRRRKVLEDVEGKAKSGVD